MDFGDAIRHLKLGKRVRREGWGDREMRLGYQPDSSGGKLWVAVWTGGDQAVLWRPLQSDVLAEDWVIAL